MCVRLCLLMPMIALMIVVNGCAEPEAADPQVRVQPVRPPAAMGPKPAADADGSIAKQTAPYDPNRMPDFMPRVPGQTEPTMFLPELKPER